ncbi:uncharacterized protein LAESUDRAFT_751856 [Laetiporus sulphureus 93-53]|uniref:Uncharacterized protein n=1 Tax=Laetiporus sulphureus 93-53 TaxID=1314785 RepID=A0A165CMT4_9APHY|nr:uncharacterized protein LAESUDRAFT_751856 [Laetiporus sulphureus 93-53]KZT03097.1 hypothetical protein LAESUDRAFT_751856 [Laetiporus sulphureus 93-53]
MGMQFRVEARRLDGSQDVAMAPSSQIVISSTPTREMRARAVVIDSENGLRAPKFAVVAADSTYIPSVNVSAGMMGPRPSLIPRPYEVVINELLAEKELEAEYRAERLPSPAKNAESAGALAAYNASDGCHEVSNGIGRLMTGSTTADEIWTVGNEYRQLTICSSSGNFEAEKVHEGIVRAVLLAYTVTVAAEQTSPTDRPMIRQRPSRMIVATKRDILASDDVVFGSSTTKAPASALSHRSATDRCAIQRKGEDRPGECSRIMSTMKVGPPSRYNYAMSKRVHHHYPNVSRNGDVKRCGVESRQPHLEGVGWPPRGYPCDGPLVGSDGVIATRDKLGRCRAMASHEKLQQSRIL